MTRHGVLFALLLSGCEYGPIIEGTDGAGGTRPVERTSGEPSSSSQDASTIGSNDASTSPVGSTAADPDLPPVEPDLPVECPEQCDQAAPNCPEGEICVSYKDHSYCMSVCLDPDDCALECVGSSFCPPCVIEFE